MPAGVIGIAMNNGYEGTVSVTADSIIQARLASVNEDNDGVDNIAFGKPVILNADNTYSLLYTEMYAETGEPDPDVTLNKFAGIAVREVVQANTFDPQSNVGYRNATPCDVLTRGQCVIKVLGGTIEAGGSIYPVWGPVKTISGSSQIRPFAGFAGEDYTAGDDEVLSDMALPNVQFTTGIVDSNDIVEVTIKTRNVG